jgi:hypothetical protein
MNTLQKFAESAADAAESLAHQLPSDVRNQVEQKMAAGCRLSLSLLTKGEVSPEIVLELIDSAGERVRLLSVAGQVPKQH